MNMKKVSLVKRIKLFFFYRKILRKNKAELLEKLSAKVDFASRIYTVVNVPVEIFDESYNLRKSDIDTISEKYIREYSESLKKYLIYKGLNELFKMYDMKKVDKYSYLLVVGFSLFNSDKVFKRLFFIFLPVITLLLTFLFIKIF